MNLMARKLISVSFIIPSRQSEGIGQSLSDLFPDGVVLSPLGRMSYKPFEAEEEWSKVTGWLKDKRQAGGIKARVAGFGGKDLRITTERSRDWLKESKASFPSQRIYGFLVVPAWRKTKVVKGLLPIRLLQGQAFGTGLHASTRLMLRAVSRRVFDGRDTVLDVGAGSGILSFACLLKGAGRAMAVELEHAACQEMRANVRENHVPLARFKVVEGAFPKTGPKRGEKFPLILANLTAPVLKSMLKGLSVSLAKAGRLWMSGIHGPVEAAEVAGACRRAGLKITGRRKLGEWHFLEAR